MTVADARIVIVGLGPGDPDLRTVGTQRMLHEADRIVLRTRVHPGLGDLASDPRVTDCDDLYEAATAFDVLYPAIASRVIELAQMGGLTVFAVPGHPRFGERTVPLIEAKAHGLDIPIQVLDAVGFVDTTVNVLGVDPVAGGLQIADAEQLALSVDAEPYAAGLLGINPARPLLVAQLYNREVAAAVKLALTRVYPDEHQITLVRSAGSELDEKGTAVELHRLDRQEVDYLTSLWVPPLDPLSASRSSDTLARVVARLRAPGGCPWDREQTHVTLRDSVLEEAFETVDAIDAQDALALAEELGDLLLLVAMHAQLAEEDGTFRIEDVYQGINKKLIRRHPHVFGSVRAETPEAVIATWDGVKAAEKAASGAPASEDNEVDRLPRTMPATLKAAELFAPRVVLNAPEDRRAGDQLLAAARVLIERGIDPERALVTSLRNHFAASEESAGQESLATASTRGDGQG